jgi:peptidoglycan/xylan/chitin deacetylase (PgdA/CDA1 family)
MGAALAAGVLAACGRAPGPPLPTVTTPAPPPRQPRHAAVPPHEIDHGPRDRPAVALTFHGAGDPALTDRVLGLCRDAGAHVTVLAVGTWLAANPDLAARITGAGHDLGNHTYTHPTLPDLGASAARREIERCRDLLRELTGSPGRWFRPSGTPHATPLILRVAAAVGYPVCLSYDVDPMDYTDPGARAVRSRVAAQVRPGSIVSLHLGHAGTVEALPGVLADLRGRGLTAVTMSTLVGAR